MELLVSDLPKPDADSHLYGAFGVAGSMSGSMLSLQLFPAPWLVVLSLICSRVGITTKGLRFLRTYVVGGTKML